MTFRPYMNGYKAFLASAKNSLTNMKKDSQLLDENILYGSDVVISCVACIESLINHIFITKTDFKWFDELRLKSKIEICYYLNGNKVNWGRNPYQMFSNIIAIRNWLIHFKDENLGLLGADNQWINDEQNVAPKYDPYHIFQKETCKNYYEATRTVVIELAQVSKLNKFEYEFAQTETYENFIDM